jgi:pyridoxine 5'-phosphate synthase PdxJ
MLQTLPNISFIFSGSDQHMLIQMFENKDRPFYSFGQYMKLGRIPPQLYLEFIQNHFKKGKKMISDEDIMEVIEWCNYRTFNIQMVMNRLYSLDKRKIDDADVRMVKETILREKGEMYYTIRRLVTSG